MAPDDCCRIKTVRDALGEDSKLNGVYTLKTKEDSKPDPICLDGCVYTRDNQEYCFIDKPGPSVVCEVSIFFSNYYMINTDTWMVFRCQSWLILVYGLYLPNPQPLWAITQKHVFYEGFSLLELGAFDVGDFLPVLFSGSALLYWIQHISFVSHPHLWQVFLLCLMFSKTKCHA